MKDKIIIPNLSEKDISLEIGTVTIKKTFYTAGKDYEGHMFSIRSGNLHVSGERIKLERIDKLKNINSADIRFYTEDGNPRYSGFAVTHISDEELQTLENWINEVSELPEN